MFDWYPRGITRIKISGTFATKIRYVIRCELADWCSKWLGRRLSFFGHVFKLLHIVDTIKLSTYERMIYEQVLACCALGSVRKRIPRLMRSRPCKDDCLTLRPSSHQITSHQITGCNPLKETRYSMPGRTVIHVSKVCSHSSLQKLKIN